jgi:hypothetical protein
VFRTRHKLINSDELEKAVEKPPFLLVCREVGHALSGLQQEQKGFF